MSELIHQFGIDWRLLVAQVVNFFILFFVLYRFAYRPILSMLSERKRKIEEGMKMREAAIYKLREADKEREAIIKKTEQESLQLIAKAEKIGEEQAKKVIGQAMKKEEALIREGKIRAEEEKKTAAEEFSIQAAELVKAAVAKVVEISPEAVDEQLVKRAFEELRRVRI